MGEAKNWRITILQRNDYYREISGVLGNHHEEQARNKYQQRLYQKSAKECGITTPLLGSLM